MDERTVGILGGGQLGRMIVETAQRLGIQVAVLDPGGFSSPAGQLTSLNVQGDVGDTVCVQELARICDIFTAETEHINTDALEMLESTGKPVHPNSKTLRIIQDKYYQKLHLASKGIPLPEYMLTDTIEAVRDAALHFGYPFVLKSRKPANDGRSYVVLKSESELTAAFELLGGRELFVEKWIPFAKELAVMIVRTKSGLLSYPIVEHVHRNGICHLVIAPAQVSAAVLQVAEKMALQAASCFDGIGIYGVKLFLLPDDSILLSEIVPRPHNSGHYTIEACDISQFEMHLRAVLDLPCPQPKMRVQAAVMINILGEESMETTKALMRRALAVNGAGLHWYGKAESRPGLKMGHVTITGSSIQELKDRVEALDITQKVHGLANRGPRVGILMDNDSDLSVMQQAAMIMEDFGITFELTIVSAHRTPNRMYTYAQSAAERGIEVIIAGMEGAAHLPGMVAALTSLPVIGVPIMTPALSGNDSVLSIVQMSKGTPVATVAIDSAVNAGLLAVRILAAQDKELQARMDQFMEKQEEETLRKAAKLDLVGFRSYQDGA